MKLPNEHNNIANQAQQDTTQAGTQKNSQDLEQHSLGHSILLHLLPGAIITTLYFLTAGPTQAAGFPPLFALLICTLGVLSPTLGHLLLEGKRRNGKLSLKGI